MGSRQLLRSKSGQAVIEFVLSLMFLMGLIVFIVHLAMSFAVGNFIHYATYMSARTLLSSASSSADQKENAELVLVKMLKGGTRFSGWITPGGNTTTRVAGANIVVDPSNYGFNDRSRGSSWMSGVLYQFDLKIFLGPISGTGASNLTLTSESWLGREVSSVECIDQLRRIQGGTEVYIDNGC